MARGELSDRLVGSHRLGELIGKGGVASVYRTVPPDGGRPLAAKVLRSELVADRVQCRALREEFQRLACLDHPGIPRPREMGVIDSRPTIIMGYVPGTNLSSLRQQGRAFDVVGAFVAMVRLAAHVHERGVIHNDLKLENFILQPDARVGLVDFGNARRPGGLIRRLFVRQRPVFGTATYLAPELITGGEPSYASDCYALGVCAHLLLAGKALFDDPRQSQRLRRAVKERPPTIAERVPALPRPLSRILDACLHKDPQQRPADARALRRLLKDCFATSGGDDPSAVSKVLLEQQDGKP